MTIFRRILGCILVVAGGASFAIACGWAARLEELGTFVPHRPWVIALSVCGWVMFLGGWALLRSASPPEAEDNFPKTKWDPLGNYCLPPYDPTLKIEWPTAQKILMVAHPGGSRLLAIHDRDPALARIIFDAARDDESPKEIFNRFARHLDEASDFPVIPSSTLVHQAIDEAILLFKADCK